MGSVCRAGPFHSPIGVDGSSTDFSGRHMSWRYAAARLALPEKDHKSMIKFLKAATTRGPDPLRRNCI